RTRALPRQRAWAYYGEGIRPPRADNRAPAGDRAAQVVFQDSRPRRSSRHSGEDSYKATGPGRVAQNLHSGTPGPARHAVGRFGVGETRAATAPGENP